MTEAMEILRGLIERVSVRHVAEGLEVELVGEIANMIQLSTGVESLAKEPYRSSVKVVAGACNARYLQLVDRQIPWVFPTTTLSPIGGLLARATS
jgi:hypothetical protein